MQITAVQCPHFQLSEDEGEPIEHALELKAPPSDASPTGHVGQICGICQRPVLLCPYCPGASRLLSRFCRNCGKALPQLHWPVAGGSWDSDLLESDLGLPRAGRPCPCPPLASTAVLASGGVLVQIGKEEQARFLHGDRILASIPFPASAQGVSTCLMGGLLVVGLPERLLISDMVDILELSPGSPTRRKTVPLRGQLAAPLACDGQQTLVALSRDQGRGHLQVFQLMGARLQLNWTRPLDEDRPHANWLSVCAGCLLLAREDGFVECFALDTGEQLGSLKLPTPLAYLPPLARLLQQKPSWIVAGADGSVVRLCLQGRHVESMPLAPASDGPLFGMGADSQQVVLCHGKSLRRIDGTSGKVYELELPQYCTVAPWVQKNRALAVSQEGTLYALSLGTSNFRVEHALRLPGNFQGATLPPLQHCGDLWLVDGDGLLIQVELRP